MSIEKEQLVESILSQIETLGTAMYHSITANMITSDVMRLDLTMLQMKTFFILYQMGAKRMCDIAKILSISTATVTGVVDRLVARNYVIRENDPGDRRVVMCRLSDEGEALISGIWSEQTEYRRELISQLSQRHLNMFADALSLITQAIAELKETQSSAD